MSIRCCDLSKSAYFEHRGSNSAVLFFSRHKMTRAHELPSGGFALSGRLLLLHRLSRGTRTAAGGFDPDPGGEFFAEPQRGAALCGARGFAAPAAGAKRKGHLRFPFLFELLPFPCFLIWRRPETGDRFEKRNGSRVTVAWLSSTFSQFTDSILLHMASYSTQARHDRVAQHFGHVVTHGTCEIKRSVQFIFAGAGRYNAQKNWAALSCRPLRGLNLMCSRTVSDTANR